MKDLPINEALGVFVSVAGLDFLADGNAQLFKAVAAAALGGLLVFARRRWLARRQQG